MLALATSGPAHGCKCSFTRDLVLLDDKRCVMFHSVCLRVFFNSIYRSDQLTDEQTAGVAGVGVCLRAFNKHLPH